MGKLSNTWALLSASWEVLKKDREILVFPLISGICAMLVLASFALPLFISGGWRPPGEEAAATEQVLYYAMLFSFYFCTYFVITFFNAAIIACATIRMNGGDPTVADGFRAAFERLPLIAGWSLIAATVGFILRLIEDRSPKIGRIVASLLGMAWSVTSFLVIPILVNERKSPMAAFKESAALFKKTWGEQILSNVGFGLIFFLLALPAVLLVMAAAAGGGPGLIIAIAFAVIYFVALSLIQSALQAIFQAALYIYARRGQAPPGFDAGMLRNAMIQR